MTDKKQDAHADPMYFVRKFGVALSSKWATGSSKAFDDVAKFACQLADRIAALEAGAAAAKSDKSNAENIIEDAAVQLSNGYAVDFRDVAKQVLGGSKARIAELEAQLAAEPAPGWKVVPVQPTPEMCAEGLEDEGVTIKDGRRYAFALYSVMVAVAPPQPQQIAAPASEPPDDDPTPKAQYRRMFNCACEALGEISESLGLDPNEGGGEPILAAIEELKAQSAPAAASGAVRAYISPTRTVADLVSNLMLMDQSLPIYGAQTIEHPEGRRRTIAIPPTVSRERVKDSRWIGEGDTINAAVIWTKAEQPAPAVEGPVAIVAVSPGHVSVGWMGGYVPKHNDKLYTAAQVQTMLHDARAAIDKEQGK